MFSRETSSIPLKPQRSKSASSIKYRASIASEASIVDSQNIHQDAITAANLAYERANRHHTVQNGTAKSVVEQNPSKDAGTQPTLGRRQSVRFVGPNAVPTRTCSITRRMVPGYHESHELNRLPIPARPTDPPPYLDESSVTALPEEFNEDYVASEPSSYRKLRKAKSMFSPRKAPSMISTDRITNERRHFQRHSVQSSGSTSEQIRVRDPRLKRSFSFLRGVNDRMSISNQQYETHDAAIQLARDTYLRELEQQRLKEQPSFFGLGKRQKPQRAFRRTVRTSSSNSYGTAISSPLSAVNPERPRGIGSKARIISQTWKEKIKRAFKRSSDEDTSIPPQHLDASQPHYGGATSGSPGSQGSGQLFPPIPEPNAELLRRVETRDSSLRSEPVYVSKSPRLGSIRSVSSDEEATHDKSRVTSWTNSTAASTLKIPSFIDRKRLSIIREDGGPHQPSSSSSQRCRGDVGDGYATFRQPIIPGGTGRVETKRMFSALRRQIDENSRRAVHAGESDSDSASDQQQKRPYAEIPGRSSSDWSTVRCIRPLPESQLVYTGIRSSPTCTFNDFAGCYDGRHETPLDVTPDRSRGDDGDLREDVTPQQIADMNETSPGLPKGPLREVKSAFFPPSMRIERSSASPFRRAMCANNENEDAAPTWKLNGQRAMSNGQNCSPNLARSESVYSRSSCDFDVLPRSNSTPTAVSTRNDETGAAIILSRDLTPRDPSPEPFFSQRHSSTRSSGDWKNHRATELGSIEGFRGLREPVLSGVAVDDRHHKREGAYIDDDDDDDVKIASIQAPSSLPKQPLRPSYSGILGQASPKTEMGLLMNSCFAVPTAASDRSKNGPAAPPAILSREQSKQEHVNTATGLRSQTPNSLHQDGSHASSTPQSDFKMEIATNSPRSSPKRAERLRRLKSSSGIALARTSPRNENQKPSDQHFPSGQQRHNSGDSVGKENIMPVQAGMNTKLVNSFLRDRRRDMQISDESGNDAAFL